MLKIYTYETKLVYFLSDNNFKKEHVLTTVTQYIAIKTNIFGGAIHFRKNIK